MWVVPCCVRMHVITPESDLEVETEFAVFSYCRFSLFLKDRFFPDYLEVATAVVVSVWSW